MTGPKALAIVKDIYAEDVDVEDKLTAMQDVFCMCNLQADNPCRRISKKRNDRVPEMAVRRIYLGGRKMNTERIKQAMAQLATLNAKIASNSACNVSSEENHANAIEIVLDALQSFLELGITPEQIREIDKLYAEKCKELTEEKKKHRWIPCSEQIPEEAGKYEVTAYNGHRLQTTQVK